MSNQFTAHYIYRQKSIFSIVRDNERKVPDMLEFLPRVFDIYFASEIAKAKSRHTNDSNQNGDNRDADQKFNKALLGVMAELVVYRFITEYINVPDDVRITWYDLERDDFLYRPNEEYDIRITFGDGSHQDVNVRSSFHKTNKSPVNILDAWDSQYMDYASKYTNSVKAHEHETDVSIRVLHQFVDQGQGKGNYSATTDRNIWKMFLTSNLRTFLVGFVEDEQLTVNPLAKKKHLGQGNAEYDTLPLSEGNGILGFSNWLNEQAEIHRFK